jgi:hypothetical protein
MRRLLLSVSSMRVSTVLEFSPTIPDIAFVGGYFTEKKINPIDQKCRPIANAIHFISRFSRGLASEQESFRFGHMATRHYRSMYSLTGLRTRTLVSELS